MMRRFFHRNALLVILGVVFLIVGVSYAVTLSDHQEQGALEQQRISELDTQVQAKLESEEVQQQQVLESSLGIDEDRVSTDTALIRELMTTVATWDSGKEYEEAREQVMRRYNLEEDSQFMERYFVESVSNTDSEGTVYYMIDSDGLNSSLSSLDVRSLGVTGTEYSYMVIADISAVSTDGMAAASMPSVLFVTVDGEGVFTDISAFASTSAPLTSG